MSENLKIWIDILALILIYVFVLYPRWKKKKHDYFVINTVMYLYLGVVMYFTVMPVIVSLPFIFSHAYTINIIPFVDYINEWGDYLKDIFLNVLMTIPFGFLFPMTQGKNKRGFLRTVLFTFLLSFCIEFAQFILVDYRLTDITDIITNTFGGMIGYLFYLLTVRDSHRIRLRIRNGNHKSN